MIVCRSSVILNSVSTGIHARLCRLHAHLAKGISTHSSPAPGFVFNNWGKKTLMGQIFSGVKPKGRTELHDRHVANAVSAPIVIESRTTPCDNPLPSTIHMELGPSQLCRTGRIIVVGDVHGCCDELLELLEKCNFKEKDDNLVLVGDLVNKGPKSCEVISTAIKYGAWAVRGNHDDVALLKYAQLKENPKKVKKGWAWVRDLTKDQVSYMTSLPFTISIPSHGVVVVHAGMVPKIALNEQDLGDLYRMRDVVRNGNSGWVAVENRTKSSKAWASAWQGPEHVIFGHDAIRGLQRQPYATGLDTGCVYGRQLSACILPSINDMERLSRASTLSSAQIVQVKAKQVYEEPKIRAK